MARGEGFSATIGQGVRFMKQHFIENFGADPDFLQDIGMESKGLEFSEYVTKDSLAQQVGYSMALKGASEPLQDKFFRNMSSRAAEMIKEDMEFMGPVRLKDVEAGQQRVVKVIRALEDAGEIIIARGETEMIT